MPSVVAVYVTRRWRIWVAECLFAILAWIMFLGPAGDLSCTDCAFALQIPIYVAAPQTVLVVAGLLSARLREDPGVID